MKQPKRWKNENGSVTWVNPKWWKWLGRASRVWLVLAAIALALLVAPEKSGAASSWAFRQGPQRVIKDWQEFELVGGVVIGWQCIEICIPSDGGVTVCRTWCYRIF